MKKHPFYLKTICCTVFLAMFLLFASGCYHGVPNYVTNPTWDNLSEKQRDLLIDLKLSGMQVIQDGMVFKFVIPTDCFFRKDTRMLKSYRERDLDRLAEFIHSYAQYFERIHVTVAGFTDKTFLNPARDKLAKHYANTVAAYLQEDDISSKAITVRGLGSKYPIASNHYPMGTAFNRRVEVTVW